MNLTKYQGDAATFAKDKIRNDLDYLTLGLCGESGEVAELVKKAKRDDFDISTTEVALELGDVLWYVSQIAFYFNITLGEIATMNLKKLEARYKRDVIRNNTRSTTDSTITESTAAVADSDESSEGD